MYLATKIPGQKDLRSDSKLTEVPRHPSLVTILSACLLSLIWETGRGQVTHRNTSVHTTPASAWFPRILGHTWAPSYSTMSHYERQWKPLCGLLLLFSIVRPRPYQSPQNCTPEL